MGVRSRITGWVAGGVLIACAVALSFALVRSVND